MIVLPPDYVHEFFAKYVTPDRARPRPKIVCRTGLEMSVQASEFHYCSPRENNQPHYGTVEIGFPSHHIHLLNRWCEDDAKPTETVYGYVPVEVVNIIIAANGGIDYNNVKEHPDGT